MSDDLIRREDAIKAVEERSFAVRDSYIVKAILRNVPPADRPQGEWIVHKINGIPHTAECSCCHNHYEYEDLRRVGGVKWIIDLSYCPNCGARMRPKLQGTHFDSIIIDECPMKGADNE